MANFQITYNHALGSAILKLVTKYLSRRSLHVLLSPKAWRIRLTLWAGALILGLFSLLLIAGSEYLDRMFTGFARRYPLLPLLITPAGFIIIVWTVKRYFPGSEGGGVPQTIASLHHYTPTRLVSLQILCGKTAMLLAALACGASVGIGGPMVHIGASIMYLSGIYARYTPRHIKQAAIMAGGAAAIATVFSAPLAGIIFTMEELNRSFQPRRSGLIPVTVLLAMLVIALTIGYEPYLGELDYHHPGNSSVWSAALVCGIIGGVLGGIFSQGIISLTRKTMACARQHPYIFAGTCGLIVAIAGLISPTPIYGTSYQLTADFMQAPNQPPDIFFPFAKMLATAAAFISGIPGGIFGPTIAIGAGIGADLGQWFPLFTMQTAMLMSITAYFSAVFQTPITAAVLVVEISGNLDIILPIIAASFIAFAVSRLICPTPLYHVLSHNFTVTTVYPQQEKP